MDTETLLREIRAFCAREKLKPTTAGLYLHNDGKLVDRLERGGECLPSTSAKIMRKIETFSRKGAA